VISDVCGKKKFIMKVNNYSNTLQEIKSSIHQSQTKAVLAVNRVLIELYWEIGNQILKQQAEEGWGTKVIQQLSKDLKTAFPDMKGLSERNLKYMRQFAQTYSEFEFVQQVVAQIPWGHNCLLMSKLENKITRTWYAKKTIENGWSRNVLSHQIELQLFERQGKVISNFSKTLPEPQSDLVQQALKDRYIFDFLNLEERAKETELEKQLIENISKFLLELGAGFAFISQQYNLEIGHNDYYIDLLFYHTRLHCYVAIELKTGEFKPEYIGKMNFYLSALDDTIKTASDNPSIGLILCKTKDNITAEYALRGMSQPIGVSDYQLKALPSPDELKAILTKESMKHQ
jgi:predicted nuclease of restriction endonuclease-like (RecB) superfamily